jgi:ATP-binding protein involved in chromosome partitioning
LPISYLEGLSRVCYRLGNPEREFVIHVCLYSRDVESSGIVFPVACACIEDDARVDKGMIDMAARSDELSEMQVTEVLKTVKYPGYTRDIVSFGMLKGVQVKGRDVGVALQVTTNQDDIISKLRQAAEEALRAIPGIGQVLVDVRKRDQAPAGTPQNQNPFANMSALPGVQHIVAVASGKGGVGKSTVATNLAVALGIAGLRTGLLDADIYGPSIPLMMGVDEQPQVTENNRILPFVNHGIKMQSLGFFLGENAPVIWRGPMVMKAVQQLLKDTEWGELDVLVIDLPPGTGDVQLTIVQTVPLTGAILVTTPQDLALLDVKKGAEMFKTVHAPLMGIIENMSFFVCPDCGKQTEIFRRGGGQKESERLGIPLLGQIPLEPEVCDAGDSGVPLVLARPDTKAAEAFQQIAAAVIEMLSRQPRQAPVNIIN